MEDWRKNKYGLESAYSALNESEDFKFGVGGCLLILFLLACIGWLVYALLF